MVYCLIVQDIVIFQLGIWIEKNLEVKYLGTALSDDEIFERKEEFNKLDREYSKFTEVFNYLSELNNLDVMSLNECNGYKEVLASQKEIKALENNIEKYDEELKEGDLDEVNSIDAKIQAISQDISALQQEKEEYLTRIGEKKNEVKQIDEILLQINFMLWNKLLKSLLLIQQKNC
ncbi:MAG: hypothetical protein V8Q90_07690 [Bacilli bacterium]